MHRADAASGVVVLVVGHHAAAVFLLDQQPGLRAGAEEEPFGRAVPVQDLDHPPARVVEPLSHPAHGIGRDLQPSGVVVAVGRLGPRPARFVRRLDHFHQPLVGIVLVIRPVPVRIDRRRQQELVGVAFRVVLVLVHGVFRGGHIHRLAAALAVLLVAASGRCLHQTHFPLQQIPPRVIRHPDHIAVPIALPRRLPELVVGVAFPRPVRVAHRRQREVRPVTERPDSARFITNEIGLVMRVTHGVVTRLALPAEHHGAVVPEAMIVRVQCPQEHLFLGERREFPVPEIPRARVAVQPHFAAPLINPGFRAVARQTEVLDLTQAVGRQPRQQGRLAVHITRPPRLLAAWPAGEIVRQIKVLSRRSARHARIDDVHPRGL